MSENFSCCSSYLKCSDALECINKHNKFYDSCNYRKHLEAGNIFYGKNSNQNNAPKNKPLERHKYHPIYLKCYDRAYAIYIRPSYGSWSYNLKKDQHQEVLTFLNENSIPYITDLEGINKEKYDELCNCRVFIKLNETFYNIVAYNSYLIPSSIANKIAKSFEKRGITAKVETFTYRGSYNKPESLPSVISNAATDAPVPIIMTKDYKQLSIFDIAI